MTPLLELRNLSIRYGRDEIVRNLSFEIRPGESFGLVGESGSGKSSVANAVISDMPHLMHASGEVLFQGHNLLTATPAEMRALRGRRIGFVQQDPGASLNPTMRIGHQLTEALDGSDLTRSARLERAAELLHRVGLHDASGIMQRFPHQLSGGQQQRVMIAMALLPQPELILMDEPTSGLDITVEAAIAELIGDLRRDFGTSFLFISHNLHLVSNSCDRVGVLYAGDLVEQALAREIFARPRHPYTQGLVACLPGQGAPMRPIRGHVPAPWERGAGCLFASRCDHTRAGICDRAQTPQEAETADHLVLCARQGEVVAPRPCDFAARSVTPGASLALDLRDLRKSFPLRGGGQFMATKDVSLRLREGEILGVVGESGSGKSTIAKMIAGFETATAGQILIEGEDVAQIRVRSRSPGMLRKIQMVFQNPDSTLNPSHTVGWALRRAIRKLDGTARRRLDTAARVTELLRLVALRPEIAARKPRALSGGQRQRVAIARALAAHPRVLLADEAVSALDVSVQASIIELLQDVRATTGTAIVFISHDLALVRQISDRVVVLFNGKPMEIGTSDQIYHGPYHPYTEALLSAAEGQSTLAMIDAKAAGPGCPFAARCPRSLGDLCRTTAPDYQEADEGHLIYCHIPRAELQALQEAGLAA